MLFLFRKKLDVNSIQLAEKIPLSKVKKNIDKVGHMLYYCGPDVNLNS